MADSWPMARVRPGMSAVPIDHAIDLAFFFPEEGRERNDVLLVETRRHLGGCVTAIETGLRLSLEASAAGAALLAARPEPLCWPALCAQPTLLSPALLAHMQMRAGVSLMLRQTGRPEDHPGETEAEALFAAGDQALDEALAAMALAEARWLMAGGEHQAMHPDLPAAHYTELVWTAAACLAAVAQQDHPAEAQAMLSLFEEAGWAMLGRHDEQAGPIAAADRLVQRLGERADAPDLIGAALAQRRFLLFAALAGRRLRMECMQVADILVMGSVAQVAALCRALGGSDADYRRLLVALRPVRTTLSDGRIVGEAARYQEISEAQADAMVSNLRAPAALRVKLEHLRRTMV
nr:DUF2336 domain-containing protein [Sphingobium bisphenolivorans]